MERTRKAALAASLGLACAAVAVMAGAGAGGAASTSAGSKVLWQQAHDYYDNPVAPTSVADLERDAKLGTLAGKHARRTLAWLKASDRKQSGGLPPAAKLLAQREARALAADTSPAAIRAEAVERQTAQLLTVLVEFNDNANDDFSGFSRPLTWISPPSTDPSQCVVEPEGTLMNGPLHNTMPSPAGGPVDDNFSLWVEDFDRSFYQRMIFSNAGVTERVRTDLTGEDGQPGIDISGYTVSNMYKEMSRGRYDIAGNVVDWVTVPHSEAWYSADTCAAGARSDVGHPDNPRGTGQMVVDALDILADQGFDFSPYDIEDRFDGDGDGDLLEPDGIIDHMVVIHAGADQADGGGAEGTYAEWSSAPTLDPADGGYAIPGTGMKAFNYIVQAEDAGPGVVAHEYGHDLGLPDLYNSLTGTDTSVGNWDLMSAGSHTGPLFQTLPVHMGAWSKFVLGWSAPKVIEYGAAPETVRLGQTSRPPAGHEQAIRVNLPPKQISLSAPHSGANMWWSDNDQDWADVRLGRSLDVPSGGDVRFWWWNDYTIEELWDYGFLEVSTDGSTWTQLEVKNEADEVVSTDDDPNGRLGDYGGLENGLTGDSHGWQHYYVDLTPYAGESVSLRFRLATDAAFVERGWFIDDIALTADGAEVFSDDVESGQGDWTTEVESFAGTTGAGWSIGDGAFAFTQYYLAEWRNLDGFDNGFKWPYTNSAFNPSTGEKRVERVPYNVPGMLLWYRDTNWTFNDITNHAFAAPSYGSKGMVLVVDSHPDPLRFRGAAADATPTVTKNIGDRAQSSNAAFGFRRTIPFRACVVGVEAAGPCNRFGSLPPVSRFTDRQGWHPGLEVRIIDGQPTLVNSDFEASTVIPSRDNRIYTTRVTDESGNPIPELDGVDLFEDGSTIAGSGDPKDGNPATGDGDLSLGVEFQVVEVGMGGRRGLVRVTPGHAG